MKTPFVIPVRDRLSYLQELLAALAQDDHVGTIHLCDMGSTWPETVAQLRIWQALNMPRLRVHFLRKNIGARGLFVAPLFRKIVGDRPFFLSDPDVVPEVPCAKACLSVLTSHPRCWAKVGISLRVDDLPDHYPRKQEVLQWESRFWTHRCGYYDDSVVFSADVATTYCLFRSIHHVDGNGNGTPACRIGPPFTAKHLSWYEDPDKLLPDVKHYYENAPMRRWGVAEAGVSWSPLKPTSR